MENVRPVTTLLVANRGEIARRIMRTARYMGIRTVGVYADGDAEAPFVREADTAIALGGRTSAETYLDIGKVLDACRRTGANALHPGYGFLSENAEFAQAVIDAGLAWLGPAPDVIAAMGDKLSAKQLMKEAGVPTLPAVEITAATDLADAAGAIGYPVLVKAAAGGGGRGMRVVTDANDLADAVESARREAAGAFGDDTVFLEKWLATARHVEIQIIGDTHGNLVHCFERECSIQRRHQKIIEEAPSPAVNPEIRAAMGNAAIRAARKLGYSSAGTVEFLLSGKNFHFLEVNARLQVEHPVTEAIIGHDLVREQIRIAEGEPLSFTQEELSINGHAIEARLCAEDPENNFLPSPGPVTLWETAATDARFDSGVEAGSVISTEFDPMIAKVIVQAPTRREAATRLARVLESTRVQGLTTNRDFLVSTLRHQAFLAGDTTTDFIERFKPAKVRGFSAEEIIQACIAATMESQAIHRAGARVLRSIRSGWRNTIMPFETMQFSVGGENCHLRYSSRRDGTFIFRPGENDDVADELTVTPYHCGNGRVDIDIDGLRLHFSVTRDQDKWLVHGPAGDMQVTELPRYPLAGPEDSGGALVAPMPGRVLALEVSPGDRVEKGALMLILEAMKMEHRVTAPRGGVVEGTHAAEGDQVDNGQLLVTLGNL